MTPKEGTDAMRRALRGLTALGSSLLFATGALVAGPTTDTAPMNRAVANTPAPSGTVEERELEAALERVNSLGELINRDNQSPQVWRYLLQQGEALQQLALRSKPAEREQLVRMAIDSYYSAVLSSPENETTAQQQLRQLPAQLAQTTPGSPLITYAAMQEIQADYQRALAKDAEHPERAKDLLRQRLVQFADEYPKTPAAPKAIFDAAQVSESVGKLDDARRCYHYLLSNYSGKPEARKAGGALWRLGLDGETVHLELPLLYPTSAEGNQTFDLHQVHDKLVVVYFWSSASAQVAEDLMSLRHLTDHFQFHGLEVVYVNMDPDVEHARKYLSGRLTAGIHVHQVGGLDGAVAERYGIQTLPQVFLVGKEGALIKHSLTMSQLEAEVTGRLAPRGR